MSAPAESRLREASPYERIYAIVRRIPRGRLATYGQIAAIEGRSTPRMVGYALASLDASRADVPWQRVINSRGTISERSQGGGMARQRRLLQAEGVVFDRRGRVDFGVYAWGGPDLGWTETHGFYPAPVPGGR